MTTLLTLRDESLLAVADFRRWVVGGVGLTAGGYFAVTLLSVVQNGVEAPWVPRMAFTALLCCFALFAAWRGYEMLASATALSATWIEVQLGFVTNFSFPAPGLLVLPVVLSAVSLLLGARIGLIATVATICTTIATLGLGPLRRSGFDSDSVFWFTMHAISMLAAWTLTALSLSGLARVLDRLTSSDSDLADTIRFSPDGILILDGQGKVVHCNPGAETILAMTRDEIVATAVHALLPGLPHESPRERGVPVATFDPVSLVITTTDGTPLHLEIIQRRMERDRWQVLLRDVTRRVLAEVRRHEIDARLAHAQRLEAVGQLAGGLSHDFNNILTAIGGSAELLRTERDVGERDALLNEIVTARDRGAALTRQLLSFARRDVVQPCVIDTAARVHELHRLLQRVGGEQVHLDLALAPECRIKVDPSQFEQALVNLVANARDAMPDGGDCRITIRAAESPVGDRVVQVAVSDTGAGMSAEVLARAFEPFFTTKPRGQGTGLGLAAVHAMAVRSGGDATIATQPHAGTTVTVTLPRVSEPALPPRAEADDTAAVVGGATILVAEDDDGTRRIVYRLLRAAGYHVLLAPDGLEAWHIVSQAGAAIDLLLTDVMMPGLTGPALADRVRTIQPDLPVLFMTGYAESHVRTLSGPRLVGDVIAKPFTAEELIRRIAETLQRRRAVGTPHGT